MKILLNEAIPHIEKMKDSFELLSERYDTKDFTVKPVLESDEMNTVVFPFEKGTTLASLMDGCLECNDEESFLS